MVEQRIYTKDVQLTNLQQMRNIMSILTFEECFEHLVRSIS